MPNRSDVSPLPKLLHDWNDVRLILACAALGSFAKAAASLGIDQLTVGRRIRDLEAAVGRPLFHRRRSGARPTAAGTALIEKARLMEASAAAFEAAMKGLVTHPSSTVTVAATEGLLTYTVIPALLGPADAPHTVDRSLLRHPLPDLAFTSLGVASGGDADITLAPTNPGELPNVRGNPRVRKVGVMNFLPQADRSFLERHPIRRFDDLARVPLVDNSIYRRLRALDPWNDLVEDRRDDPDVLVVNDTPSMHKRVMAGEVATLTGNYASIHCAPLQVIDVAAPRMFVDLWLIADEDALREPAVRQLYDGLAAMLLKSPWYRPQR